MSNILKLYIKMEYTSKVVCDGLQRIVDNLEKNPVCEYCDVVKAQSFYNINVFTNIKGVKLVTYGNICDQCHEKICKLTH